MKIRMLLLCVAVLPVLANAEIYKWKDKDGGTRYSDVPPPSNVKHEPMVGKKIARPVEQTPLAPVDGDITEVIERNKTAEKPADGKAPLSKQEAAAKRARDAEAQKKADEAVMAEKKVRAENCKTAKLNLATYKTGGRIFKTSEGGEREYLGDAQIEQGINDAQKDIEKYCD